MKVGGQRSVTGMWTRGTGQGDGAVWPNRCGGFKDFSDGYRRTLLRWHLDLLSLTLGERSCNKCHRLS